MDARDSDLVNDEESVVIIMGTERDLGSESIDNTNTSFAKKKARAINLGKRKLRSPVWNTFTKLDTIFEDGKSRAQCKDCKKVVIDDSHHGTRNMKRHLNTCPAKNNVELFMSASELCSQKFDPLVFRSLLVEAIIKHNLPFNFVEHEGIKALFAYVCPDIKLPCRNTVKACVLRMFKIEKQALHNLLGSVEGRICLTLDLWSSQCTDGYLALTAHFVDKDWKLNKRIISFCHMPPPHSGVALCEKISALVTEWGIEKKLFSITLDNVSSNICFVNILRNQLNIRDLLLMNDDFFHVRCCARILNLIVQDGLKEIDSSVVKIRECIKYIKGSEAKKLKFQECVRQVGILDSKRGLRQDVPTRWNSTYLMLNSAIFYRYAFINLGLSDSNFESCPSSEEWDKVVKISKFLGYFYDITCLFSRTKYPTSNLFFPKVFVIQLQIKAAIDDCDSFMNKMGDYMRMKFEKYWSDYSLIMSIAIILDPRYKLHFVDWAYTKLHGVNSMEYKNVYGTLTALFNVYSEIYAHLNYSNIPMNSTPNHQTESGDAFFEDFDNNYNGPNSVEKGELQKYLDDKRLDRRHDIDVLSWWQMERFHYPILSQLARDVLTIPISTVASESAFSIRGKVLDQYRTSLLPDTVQALLCTRDWLFGKGVYAEESANVENLGENIINITLEDNISSQSSNTFSHDG
ncbi:unnamed protein product [Malus baccata var. baccata]